jgi:cbb3-type cytochrome oxidase subunit 3
MERLDFWVIFVLLLYIAYEMWDLRRELRAQRERQKQPQSQEPTPGK